MLNIFLKQECQLKHNYHTYKTILMKLKNTIVTNLLFSFFIISTTITRAQVSGSTLTEDSEKTISGIKTTVSENLLIGPNAKIEINGEWHIYSKYIFIHPQAEINGDGSLLIHNAIDAGGVGGTTILDANGNRINTTIVNANNTAISLSNVHLPSDLDNTASWNTASPASSKTIFHSSSLEVGSNLNLSVNGANILLNDSAAIGLPNHSQGNLIIDTNGSITNFATNRMISTNNSTYSTVQKKYPLNTDTSFLFPIGISAGDYTPATLFTSGGNLSISITNYNSADAPFIHEPEEGIDRIWYINNTSNNIDSIILQHNSPLTNGTLYTDTNGFITQYDAILDSWSSFSLSGYMSAGVHSTSEITATELILTKTSDAFTPLPITLLSFTAQKAMNTSVLQWSTVNEKNNKGFYIHKSKDATKWENIGFVNSLSANGNSGNHILNYQFVDNKPTEGLNYYKLQQIDFDGTSSYSTVEKVYFDNIDTQIEIYPNPTQNDAVWLTGLNANETILVIDISGKIVVTHKADKKKEQLNLSQLAEGVYNIQIIEEGINKWNSKLIKTK